MERVTSTKYRAIKQRLAYTELNERQHIINDALKSIADNSLELRQMARQIESIKNIGYTSALEIMYTIGLKIIEEINFNRSAFNAMGNGPRDKYLLVTLFDFSMDAISLIGEEFNRQGIKI